MRNNKNLRKQREKYFDGSTNRSVKAYRHKTSPQRDLTLAQLMEWRKKLIIQNRQEKNRKIVVLFLAIVIAGSLIIWASQSLSLSFFTF